MTGTMLRTLLYVTTHLSEWHTSGLRCLWPAAARRARLLRDADVVVFNSGRPATAAQLAAVAAAFPRYNNRSVEIFSAEATRQVHRKAFTLGSTKKQMGAILALSEAEARGWFDGYDWVVRLNPDVIVSEDRFLRTHMARDGIDAVLAFCGRSSPSGTSTSRVHTDFMAWRPATLPRGQFALPPNATTVCAQPGVMECNAERHATRALAPIVASGRYAELPQTFGRGRGGCRVDSATADSRVVHHLPWEAAPACDRRR